MKVIKVRYYEATNEFIPLDPQPTLRINGRLQYERSGTDEKGDFTVIDFISEEATYFDYDAKGQVESKELSITTEEEWSKPAEILDTVNTDMLLSGNVPTVDVNTSEKLVTTNIEQNQPTSPTGIESMIQTIKRLCLNVLDVIISIFRK